jgi:signal transduction histidine kinase
MPHLFDLYMQAEPSSERQHGGLGLGLALVKSLVELHGGDVRAASDGVGLGSSFHIRLPLAPQRSTACLPDAFAAA